LTFDLVENILRDFTSCVWFKTSLATTGMISVVGVNEGHNDRHMGLKEGKPYVRIWKNTKWISNVILNDNQWHHFCYTVITGTGQTMYIDGEKKNHIS